MTGAKGRSGSKPLRTTIKLLRDTLSPSRLNMLEPMLAALEEAPPAPSWLPEEGRRCWKKPASVLSEMRILTKADLAMLGLLALLEGELIQGAREGTPCTASKAGRVQSLLCEFGLSHASRSRVAAEPPQDTRDLEAEYFSGPFRN